MFHHTKIVQRDRPKPHLRLMVKRAEVTVQHATHMSPDGRLRRPRVVR